MTTEPPITAGRVDHSQMTQADHKTPTKSATSLPRAILFTLIAVLLAIAALEGIATASEPWLFPYKRAVPIASPNAPGDYEFRHHAEQMRAEMPTEDLPMAKHSGIPLFADEARGWALAPDSSVEVGGVVIRGNDVGMRGDDLDMPVQGDVRLFTLGDSSIFGDGVDEIDVFSTVTAGLLARSWQRKVLGIIGALPGHDSEQSLTSLKGWGPSIQPSWVVIGNMWSDVYGQEEEGAQSFTYLPPVQGLLRKSALYRLMWRGYSPYMNAQVISWIENPEDIGGSQGKASRVGLEKYFNNLTAMVAEAKKVGARPAFVMLPAPMDFDAVPVPDTVQQYRFAMKRVAELENAPLLDGPALFKKKEGSMAYFFDNVHPTPEGHFLLGEGLAELLAPMGAPPKGQSHYEGYSPSVPYQPPPSGPDRAPMGSATDTSNTSWGPAPSLPPPLMREL